jgi:hypothetical protein
MPRPCGTPFAQNSKQNSLLAGVFIALAAINKIKKARKPGCFTGLAGSGPRGRQELKA